MLCQDVAYLRCAWNLDDPKQGLGIVFPLTLVNKGMPMRTVLAFTMAVTALSLPAMVILKKVLRPQPLAAFIGLMTVGMICIGYLFNAILTHAV